MKQAAQISNASATNFMEQLLPERDSSNEDELVQQVIVVDLDSLQSTGEQHQKVLEAEENDDQIEESFLVLDTSTATSSITGEDFITTYSKLNMVDSCYLALAC
jgi:hypothetical protein